MIKFAYLINRVDGMTFEEFVEYHRNHHAPLFTSIPEAERYVRKYTVSHPVPAENYPAPAYDGLTEIWFDSWADHDAFFASENYRLRVHPDEAKFIDQDSIGVMVTEEKTVI
ncbi:EthD domain-containing protein [Actinoallomurus spadix]|uniref:EthD domain-containing protein n=1 Tax=Actinoallomurus spadix TaxID=79912 RepID=A0ABN0WA19_9ACTN|nr:EthD domain-containing protein [Actinoallomurus spadix]MCO5990707.1 EthD domain-containing protein [Actinoallomurus spadix]